MNEIIEAINKRLVLSVSYDGGERLVEPHTLGTNRNTGKTLLRAYQTHGASTSGENEGWKIMNLSKMSSIQITGNAFSPRQDYVRGDSIMTGGIIAEI